VVASAFGDVAVDTASSGRSWTTVRDSAVVPYDAEWTAATADALRSQLVIAKEGGRVQTNAMADANGYYGWKLKSSDWGYGTFDLALTFPDAVTNAWDAELTRFLDGTLIKMQ
jgi:hypothetical protein